MKKKHALSYQKTKHISSDGDASFLSKCQPLTSCVNQLETGTYWNSLEVFGIT